MKFEVGKFYKTRDGIKAQIFMLDNGEGLMMGAVFIGPHWLSKNWRSSGAATYDCDLDLVSEWREPIKYSVEFWGNEWKPDVDIEYTFSQHIISIGGMWAKKKVEACPIKYRITVEELPE